MATQMPQNKNTVLLRGSVVITKRRHALLAQRSVKNKKGPANSRPLLEVQKMKNYSLPVPGVMMKTLSGRFLYLTSRFGFSVRSVLADLSVALVRIW